MHILISLILLNFGFLPNQELNTSHLILISDITYNQGSYLLDGKEASGILVDYHENQRLKSSYKVVAGKLHGLAEDYYENGNLKTRRSFTFNKLFGKFEEFDSTGKLIISFRVDLNAYQLGEKVLDLSTKKRTKGRNRKSGILYFMDEKMQIYRSSEQVHIANQNRYFIRDEKGKLLYKSH